MRQALPACPAALGLAPPPSPCDDGEKLALHKHTGSFPAGGPASHPQARAEGCYEAHWGAALTLLPALVLLQELGAAWAVLGSYPPPSSWGCPVRDEKCLSRHHVLFCPMQWAPAGSRLGAAWGLPGQSTRLRRAGLHLPNPSLAPAQLRVPCLKQAGIILPAAPCILCPPACTSPLGSSWQGICIVSNPA